MHEHILSVLTHWLSFYDKQEWIAVLVTGLLLSTMGHHFCTIGRHQIYARRSAIFLCLPYFVYVYPSLSFYDAELLLGSTLRLLLLYLNLKGACCVVVPLVCRSCSAVRNMCRSVDESLRQWSASLNEEREKRRQCEAAKKQPAPLPRSDRLEQQMQQAQLDFELEARLIQQSTALDEDEKHIALMQCKQRLLARIAAVIQ